MKGIQSLFLTCILSLPLLVDGQLEADLPVVEGVTLNTRLGGKRGVALSTSSSTFSTATNTIEVSSITATIFYSSSTSSTAATSSSDLGSSPSSSLNTSSLGASPSPWPVSKYMPHQRQTLMIVLSAVLGFAGVLLIASLLLLVYRCRQGRTPFGQRGVSPINDDEIESWRGTIIEQKQERQPTSPWPKPRKNESITITPCPEWMWTASPTPVRSVLSPTESVPASPPFLAKAPNSRAGLTDETIPGADPFIPAVKRQSSRLSKAPPGHGRSKSRRSSMSAKSVWSYAGTIAPNPEPKANDRMQWYDQCDNSFIEGLRGTDCASSSPGTSIFNGLSAGGLSPRPQPQARPWVMDEDIGRAIS